MRQFHFAASMVFLVVAACSAAVSAIVVFSAASPHWKVAAILMWASLGCLVMAAVCGINADELGRRDV